MICQTFINISISLNRGINFYTQNKVIVLSKINIILFYLHIAADYYQFMEGGGCYWQPRYCGDAHSSLRFHNIYCIYEPVYINELEINKSTLLHPYPAGFLKEIHYSKNPSKPLRVSLPSNLV